MISWHNMWIICWFVSGSHVHAYAYFVNLLHNGDIIQPVTHNFLFCDNQSTYLHLLNCHFVMTKFNWNDFEIQSILIPKWFCWYIYNLEWSDAHLHLMIRQLVICSMCPRTEAVAHDVWILNVAKLRRINVTGAIMYVF